MTRTVNTPEWIKAWWPELYESLADKERYGTIDLAPLYDAMNGYKDFNRETEMALFYFRSYGYYTLVQLYNADPSYLPLLNSREIYNLNGFGALTLSRPRNYYIVPPVEGNEGEPEPSIPEILQADIDMISGAAEIESARIEEIGMSLVTNMYPLEVKIMFDDVPLTGVKMEKPDAGKVFFEDNEWKYVHDGLNVGRLEKPSYIK